GAIRRAAKALGYDRVITYTLEDESGATLKAAGWKRVGRRGGGSWGREGRPREDNHPTVKKILWEANRDNISPTLVADEGVRFRVEPGTLAAGRKRKPGNRYSYPESSAHERQWYRPEIRSGADTSRRPTEKPRLGVGRA